MKNVIHKDLCHQYHLSIKSTKNLQFVFFIGLLSVYNTKRDEGPGCENKNNQDLEFFKI